MQMCRIKSRCGNTSRMTDSLASMVKLSDFSSSLGKSLESNLGLAMDSVFGNVKGMMDGNNDAAFSVIKIHRLFHYS